MRTITLFTLTLLVAACGLHQHEAPPSQKTSIDVALGCLEDLRTCEDWEPTRGPKLEPRHCADEDEDCGVVDYDCKDEARRCRQRNREDADRIFESPCQRKVGACIRLVEAAQPEKEIHHHR